MFSFNGGVAHLKTQLMQFKRKILFLIGADVKIEFASVDYAFSIVLLAKSVVIAYISQPFNTVVADVERIAEDVMNCVLFVSPVDDSQLLATHLLLWVNVTVYICLTMRVSHGEEKVIGATNCRSSVRENL